ncbi:LacI family DNA-binding transcriptional regulator [Egicoccus halophilus]|uniref:LacI family transcriptional regulator n=1 Tax=Egicoccus halophilus TaxID=1670830 RepID=A0A8J3A8Q3_9ACTN|nr:LacI family DNA-binding transcriptional regulator [Egicoccus halophilus]GGI06749.1 LacI family transcriptional regulator [Egicoccus halophilus]
MSQPPTPRPTAPTLQEVARAAGVSRSTVSRVVTGSPRVSAEARRAVEEAVARLGYVPNRAARSLATRRTGTIALVVREPESRVFDEPFFAGIVRAVSSAVARTELQLVLLLAAADPQLDPDGSRERDRIERYLTGGHADGALLLSLHGDDPLPQRLHAHGVPVVLGGRPIDDQLPVSWVDVDNLGGAELATTHLLAGGRRHVGALAGPPDMVAARDRLTGFRRARAAAGLPEAPTLEAVGDFTREGGARAMRTLLAREPDLDGVVAASDLAAVGALQALAAVGRRVPEDVAVVGFDDSLVAASAQPPLTTVRQPIDQMGGRLVELLCARLAGESAPRHVVLPTELVVRHST